MQNEKSCLSLLPRVLTIGLTSFACGLLLFGISLLTPVESGIPAYKDIFINHNLATLLPLLLMFVIGIGVGIWVSISFSKSSSQKLSPQPPARSGVLQTRGDHSFVRDSRGYIIGFWIKDPEYVNDRDKLSFLIMAALMKEGIPENEMKSITMAILSGTYRVVENHYDNNGGLFVMLPGGKAPGEN